MSYYRVPETTDIDYPRNHTPSLKCCPVCKGKGTIGPFFYSHEPNNNWTVAAPPQTCRSCDGKGYIIVK